MINLLLQTKWSFLFFIHFWVLNDGGYWLGLIKTGNDWNFISGILSAILNQLIWWINNTGYFKFIKLWVIGFIKL